MLHKKSSGVVDVGPEKGREEKVLISLTQSDDPNYPSDFMYNIVWRLVRFFYLPQHSVSMQCWQLASGSFI